MQAVCQVFERAIAPIQGGWAPCWCAVVRKGLGMGLACALTEHVGHVQQALGDLGQFQALVHRGLAQL
jgi:hypothetical protein